ncbi:MAG: glutamate synthase-related protein [Xanthomonadales bacterium]|nr:glutamate synthase-related protein [Xanthomonadales bacterium]
MTAKLRIRDIKYYAAYTDCLLEHLLATSCVVAGSGLWFISMQKATGIPVRLLLYLMFIVMVASGSITRWPQDKCSITTRAMMFVLGCIQSRSGNTDKCPSGIATQNPAHYEALDVKLKDQRVANYHQEMIKNLLELLAAAGLESLDELRPGHIHQRVGGTVVKSYDELYPPVKEGCLLTESTVPEDLQALWVRADANKW